MEILLSQRQPMQRLSALRHWSKPTIYLQNLAIEGFECLLYIAYTLELVSWKLTLQYPITNYLDVKLEDSELVEPAFNKHLGDNLTSVAKGDNLGIVKLDLELEAADSMIFKLPALLRGNRSF